MWMGGILLSVGTVYTIMPIPPEAGATEYFPAGAVTIGVEARALDNALIADHFSDITPEQQAEIDANKPADLDDGGVSIHVCASGSLEEYVRFDCFRGDPHYHYITPAEGHQEIVKFDSVAHGDMLEWALSRLVDRLPQMLARAGATHLAGAVDTGAVHTVLPRVRAACGVASVC
jgi:hypothetical protein